MEGLRREVWEETGIHISRPELSGVYKNKTRQIVALVFRCDLQGAIERKDDGRSSRDRWLTKAKVLELADPAYAARLLDAFEDGTAIRAHDE